jgi:hypothetical protein
MALLYTDGFDVGDFALRWPYSSGTYTTSTTTRFGTGMSVSQVNGFSSNFIGKSITPSARIFLGFAMNMLLVPGTIIKTYTDNGATTQISVTLNSGGSFSLVKGTSTVLATSAAGLYPAGSWQYIELCVAVNSTTGYCELRVNGGTAVSFTGNTRNGGTSTLVDRFDIYRTSAGTESNYWDDLYVCDNTGTTNNTFLGDIQVQTLLPNGAGASTQFTPTGAATNWQAVADVPYSTSTYNSASTVGNRDLYTLSDLNAATGTVLGIQTNMIINKTSAGTANLKAAIQSGGTVYYDPTIALSTTTTWTGAVREVDPATSSAWTVNGVNNLQAGTEVA